MFTFEQILNSFTLAIASATLSTFPVYVPLRFSLGVDSIETFAKEGVVNKELDFYFDKVGVKEEQKEKLQQTLSKRYYDINLIMLARFLNIPSFF